MTRNRFTSGLRRGTVVPYRSETPRSPAPEIAKLNRLRFMAFFLLAFITAAPLLIAQVGYSEQAKQIGIHLKCMCRGCDMSAGNCAHPGGSFSGPCDTAKSMLKEVDQHLGKGESEQQIIDAFVAEYGTVVYVEPPKKGFGLVAWLMPVFYCVFGLGLVVLVVRKWAVRTPSPEASAAAAATARNPALDRARAQAARETED
jgi:cytochrome c-type biogenesis protein CcmH/NrfF